MPVASENSDEGSRGALSLNHTARVLAKVMGEEKANLVCQDCLAEAGLKEVRAPQELLRFGRCLVNRGGFIGIVGRSVMADALMAGARIED